MGPQARGIPGDARPDVPPAILLLCLPINIDTNWKSINRLENAILFDEQRPILIVVIITFFHVSSVALLFLAGGTKAGSL